MTDKGEKPEANPEGEKPEGGGSKNGKESQYETFDDFLATVGEPERELYDSHVAGLKSALDKEREEASNLAKTLRELKPKAKKGSELEEELSKTLSKLEEAEKQYQETQRRAAFLEEAIKPAVGCKNPKAAYALAKAEDLFDKDGSPKWGDIRETAPEIFGEATVTKAGARGKTTGDDINAEIRRSAGF